MHFKKRWGTHYESKTNKKRVLEIMYKGLLHIILFNVPSHFEMKMRCNYLPIYPVAMLKISVSENNRIDTNQNIVSQNNIIIR